jgi:hypothetical protein
MATARSLPIGGRQVPLVLPSLRDPRLHVAAVIISIHILGQVGLGFHVTVPQILAAILTCAVIEVLLTYRHSGALVWPASAMLTGSGVALILRSTSTPAGDPWGFEDWYLFAAIAGLALATKYVIRYRGSHVFNPSNIGLVAAFIVLGAQRIQPLDFWWGPLDAWLVLAYAIILVGGALITRRLHLLAMALTYWLTLIMGIGILAASGHCMIADWAFRPVCGQAFWWTIATSPEVMIFLLFMLTDPKTIPAGRMARIAFAVSVGVLSTMLIAPQTTEFGAKVALLASLVVVCAARPLFERFLPRPGSEADQPRRAVAWLSSGPARADLLRTGLRIGLAFVLVGVIGTGIVIAGNPARPAVAQQTGNIYLDQAAIDPASLPAVAIDANVTEWNIDRVREDAPGLALTLARSLEAENQAMLSGDVSLLQTVDHGDRLDEMTARMDEARSAGETTVRHYDFESLLLTVKLLARQSGLGMAFESTGKVTEQTFAGDGRLLDSRTSPFAETFVIRQVFDDDRWFVVGALPPD